MINNNDYQMERGGSTISHLMFMDDIKLVGKSEREIPIQMIVRLMSIIRIEFRVRIQERKDDQLGRNYSS